ncbi:MAG: O-antigen ligase family protein [Candidatus Promineifilaceae bacterium]
MLTNLVQNDRFPLAALAMAGAAGLLWYLQPQLGWIPLLIALAPWIIRAAAGLIPFHLTRLDLPMALFLATAAGGLWLSYDQTAAQAKYWLIIGAVLIFYAVVSQPWKNLWLLADLLTLLGVGVGFYFLMTQDWQTQPAKIQFINQIGLRWMSIRPALHADSIHPNVAAGLAAIILPFPLAIGLRELFTEKSWRKRTPMVLFAGATGGFLLLILLVTISRGAILAAGAAFGFWLLWKACKAIAVRRRLDPQLVFAITLTFSLTIGLILVYTYPAGPEVLINKLPGPSNVDSRVGLYTDMVHLIGDFPLFGAGLASFPGLYSQYALVIPSFVLGHSHNLFLDVTLEQGPVGALAFAAVMIGSLVLLARFRAGKRRIKNISLLRWAVGSSLIILLLHGLIDDPLYGSRAVVFLFLIPGMAVAVAQLNGWDNRGAPSKKRLLPKLTSQDYAIIAAFFLVVILLFAVMNRSKIRSAWYSNRGAVEMARVELVNWPTDKWDDGRNVAQLIPIEGYFKHAFTFNPNNVTAQYRMGLIAMRMRDFQTAITYLDSARQLEPTNRGIQKSLGYSYTWVGDFDQAFVNLYRIREARQEMSIYVNWWDTQGRQDLAENAAVMEERLQATNTRPGS